VAGVFALLIYQVVEPLMNRVFSSQLAAGESVCRLLPEHAVWAFVLTLLLSLFASLFASLRAWKISPAEGLRDD
jgi:putative ABC transport system permease protein